MTSARPPFDSNRAWTRATAAIRANREVVVALAGVFFLLPSLALALLVPQPEPAPGTDEAAMIALATAYYTKSLPIALPLAVLQAAGMLGLLTLLTDRARPTVGEAIRSGFAALLPYVASQVILGMGVGMVFMIVIGVLSAAGSKAIAVAGGIAVVLPIFVRFALTAPVVAIEKWRNPLAALRRSWQLSAGNTWRIGLFFALILLASGVVMMVTMGLVGLVLTLALPAKLAALAAAVISSALGSGMVLVLVACLAATHAQLAGDGTETIGATFE